MRDIGFDEGFGRAFEEAASPGEVPARVVDERRGRYVVALAGPDGRLSLEEAAASGSLSRATASASGMPTVGDWVAARPGAGGPASIRALLARRNAFIRKAPGDVEHDRIDAQAIAANIDLALIVAAAGRDWNARRVERYLALCLSAEARALLVITKADLAEDPSALLAEAEAVAPNLPSVLVCAPGGLGLDEVSKELEPGRTAALLGSSGAGKTTLLNALAGREIARTGEVRADDQKGRHTTTHRQLFRLPSGALAIDTPGMRELQLWADADAVDGAFPEIEELAELCRFRDCSHSGEPGCAVAAALEEGLLDSERLEGWRKLSKEAAYLRTKEDRSAKEAERRRWRSIEMSRRSFAKTEKRREHER